MDDSPDLVDRAAAIAEMIALGMSPDPDDVMQLGVDLLVAGSDGPAVVALASVRPGSRWVDIEPVARAAFAEVSIDLPEPAAAGWSLARWWAYRLRDDERQTYRAASMLWGMWWDLDNPSEIGALVPLMDAWEETIQRERGPIEEQLRQAAGPIIAAADRNLALS